MLGFSPIAATPLAAFLGGGTKVGDIWRPRDDSRDSWAPREDVLDMWTPRADAVAPWISRKG